MNKIELTLEHIKESLSNRILIGSDTASNGTRKTFSYDAWQVEFVIECNHQEVARGKALPKLLKQYNDM